MARTDKLVLLLIPRYRTTQMGTGARHGQKTAVLQAGQVKLTLRNSGHRVGLEVIHAAGNNNGVFFPDLLPIPAGAKG